METLKPIGIENQIEDVLFGETQEQKTAKEKKVEFTKNNIDKITSINGSKVFDLRIDDDDIFYNLKPAPETWKQYFKDGKFQSYYYPIQYAQIEFNF